MREFYEMEVKSTLIHGLESAVKRAADLCTLWKINWPLRFHRWKIKSKRTWWWWGESYAMRSVRSLWERGRYWTYISQLKKRKRVCLTDLPAVQKMPGALWRESLATTDSYVGGLCPLCSKPNCFHPDWVLLLFYCNYLMCFCSYCLDFSDNSSLCVLFCFYLIEILSLSVKVGWIEIKQNNMNHSLSLSTIKKAFRVKNRWGPVLLLSSDRTTCLFCSRPSLKWCNGWQRDWTCLYVDTGLWSVKSLKFLRHIFRLKETEYGQVSITNNGVSWWAPEHNPQIKVPRDELLTSESCCNIWRHLHW